MVTLYTWVPPLPEVVLAQRILPDVGHSALEVKQDEETLVYVSFWPERESMIGQLTRHLKPRETRHPSSYAEESDPAHGFMQRPAEFVDIVALGLDEGKIAAGWKAIVDSQYDFLHWNCSNVTRFLLVHAMMHDAFEAIREASSIAPEDLIHISGTDDFREKLRYLATSRFIDCRPDDVRRLVHAYNALKEKAADGAEVPSESPV